MKFLLDTNILSEPRLPRPNRKILNRLLMHAGQAVTASLCAHELVFGVERLTAAKRAEYEQFVRELMDALPVVPYDLDAARWHARERGRLERAGKTPSFVDGQIAAIAASRGLTLVTKNVKDFGSFRGVTLVDWST